MNNGRLWKIVGGRVEEWWKGDWEGGLRNSGTMVEE
jgi:hypothetical protein